MFLSTEHVHNLPPRARKLILESLESYLEHDWLVLEPRGDPGDDWIGGGDDLKWMMGVTQLAEQSKVLLEQRTYLYTETEVIYINLSLKNYLYTINTPNYTNCKYKRTAHVPILSTS